MRKARRRRTLCAAVSCCARQISSIPTGRLVGGLAAGAVQVSEELLSWGGRRQRGMALRRRGLGYVSGFAAAGRLRRSVDPDGAGRTDRRDFGYPPIAGAIGPLGVAGADNPAGVAGITPANRADAGHRLAFAHQPVGSSHRAVAGLSRGIDPDFPRAGAGLRRAGCARRARWAGRFAACFAAAGARLPGPAW